MRKTLLAIAALCFCVNTAGAQNDFKPMKKQGKLPSAVMMAKKAQGTTLLQAPSFENMADRKTRADENTIDPKTLTHMTSADMEVYTLSGLPAGETSVATMYPQELMDRFHGNTITQVRTYLFPGAKNLTVWIMNGETGEILWEKKDPLAKGGTSGKEVTVKCDYVIDSEVTMVVGYDITLTGQSNAIPIVNNYGENTLLIQMEGDDGFYDYSGTYPAAYIDCVTEGEGGLLGNDVSIYKAVGGRVKAGDTFSFPVTFMNYGVNPVTSLNVKFTLDGKTFESTLNSDKGIGYMSGATFAIEEVAPEAGGRMPLDLEITGVNGAKDDYASDNSEQLRVIAINTPAKRKVVMEEFTGAWCGWCPRGLVAIENLKSAYPNDFIPISVHYGMDNPTSGYYDPYVDESYIQLSQNMSFPSAMLNRTGVLDPYLGSGETVVDDVESILAVPVEVAMGVASELNENKTMIDVSATLKFGINASPEDYSVAYVIVEDGLTGTQQTNYYSHDYSPSNGFNSAADLPNDLQFLFNESATYTPVFNDVSRKIEGIVGIAGSLANATIADGKSFVHSYSIAVPSSINNLDNVSVIAMLMDRESGEIVSAEKAKLGEMAYATGIDQVTKKVVADINVSEGAINVAAQGEVQVYSVDGKLVSNVTVDGNVSVPTMGMSGVHVIRVVTADGVKVVKATF